ncbi:MAG: hypothetical protein Kow00124_07080 [Anaerolineae bacterium]
MRIFQSGLTLYRKTIKPIRPIHVALHRVMVQGVLPLLEAFRGFRTMPDDPFWFRLELLTDRHEANTVQLVRRIVQPGMVVLDVGAHVGYYARHFARLVDPGGRVLAFEPHPRTFGILSQNVSRFACVEAEQVAVSDEEGTAELYDYLMMSASGSLHYDESILQMQKSQLSENDIAPRIATDFPVERYTVRTVPLDRFLPTRGVERVDLVKMDIEGAEMSALRGMRETIARSPRLALIMEYNPQALKASYERPQQALDEVMALGFSRMQAVGAGGALTDLTGGGAALDDLTAGLMQSLGVINLLFTRGG